MPQVVIDREVEHLPDSELAEQGMGKLVLVELIFLPVPGHRNQFAAGIYPLFEQFPLLIFSIFQRLFCSGR